MLAGCQRLMKSRWSLGPLAPVPVVAVRLPAMSPSLHAVVARTSTPPTFVPLTDTPHTPAAREQLLTPPANEAPAVLFRRLKLTTVPLGAVENVVLPSSVTSTAADSVWV